MKRKEKADIYEKVVTRISQNLATLEKRCNDPEYASSASDTVDLIVGLLLDMKQFDLARRAEALLSLCTNAKVERMFANDPSVASKASPKLQPPPLTHGLIKEALTQTLSSSSSLVVENFSILKNSLRVPVVTIDLDLHGYLILGAKDSVKGLLRKCAGYSSSLTKITLCCTTKHLNNVKPQLPDYWGIDVVEEQPLSFRRERAARPNPDLNLRAFVTLLWRSEVLAVLRQRGLARGMSGKGVEFLWDTMTATLERHQLVTYVITMLEQRLGNVDTL